jgi:hypothetical protein
MDQTSADCSMRPQGGIEVNYEGRTKDNQSKAESTAQITAPTLSRERR